MCDVNSGQCTCPPNTIGRTCDQCNHTIWGWNGWLSGRGRNVPDCLPVSSDRQNVFLPVSTNIQLEQYFFNIILFSLFETQLGLYNH